ncbi:NADH dehydrogenase [ubiquinone] 1 beta subcomplex subunit 5, mitochondrial [Chelonus insularis]|uniref:NADH dehydrogenase [ubiquinone] 1 beta subcomplex subunit 5, mitochondrial n=1 Tax=Chelonus insularis TaxID=460826 RepID=UPI00158B4428|nr:NADH dehydrogenase [ubiquinone] 1 beta subcomplex subunit 5, mitochondrial [Chelonus insularis]
MAAWSRLCCGAGQILLRNGTISACQAAKNEPFKRFMSEHRLFPLGPSRWNWHKFKDYFHMYVCLTGIPIAISIFLINIFIGPAQLAPIPEGYVPKHWEYERHPITRFFARYLLTSEQQEYEKNLHFLWAEQERRKLRMLETQVNELIQNRVDYQHQYYLPYTNAKYVRKSAQIEKDDDELYSSPD